MSEYDCYDEDQEYDDAECNCWCHECDCCMGEDPDFRCDCSCHSCDCCEAAEARCSCWCHGNAGHLDSCDSYNGCDDCDCACHSCDCCEEEDEEEYEYSDDEGYEDEDEYDESQEERVERIRADLGADTCVIVEHFNGDYNNAFAGRDGCIYLTRQFVEESDDDELAWVIAHEQSHLDHDHSSGMEEYLKCELHELEGRVNSIVSSDRGFLRKTGGVIKEVASSYIKAVGKKRENELEADREATDQVRQSNYDPEGGVRRLRKSCTGGRQTIREALTDTHPSAQQRISEIRSKKKEERNGI